MVDSLNDDLQKQLMTLFVAEAQEHLQTINQNLLALEKKPTAEAYSHLLTETLREAHSLKGAARAVSLGEIETLAHQLESLFVTLQSGNSPLGAEGFDLVYQSLDAIGTLVQSASSGQAPSANLDSLKAGLAKLLEAVQSGKPVPSARKAPRRTPPPKKGQSNSGSGKEPNDPPFPAAADDPPDPPARVHQVAKPSAVKPKPAPKKESPVVVQEEHRPEETIRLTTTKLDTLLSLMGELQVARLGSGQRLMELQALNETLSGWEGEWRKTRPDFRRMLVTADVEVFQGEEVLADGARGGIRPATIQPMLDFLQSNEIYLHNLRERVNELIQVFQADGRRMDQVAAEMEDEIRQTRMLPISTVFNAFPRMVRDLAREKGKEVSLVIQGGETAVDRSVLEQIKDPLLHLLRNCIDHGIETPEVRAGAGKDAQGTIRLSAAQQGDSLVIEIADDGAGIDLAGVRATAVKKHLLNEDTAASLSDHDALWLIFQSGFSTSPMITNLSGRGVGLDIVRQRVEHLHGLIDVANTPGKGVRFTLSVPLTVATTLCLLVRAGGRQLGDNFVPQTFAIPISNVVRLVRLDPEEIGSVEGRQAIRLNGEPVALWRLADVLGLNAGLLEKDDTQRLAVVVGAAEKRMAFLLDDVVGTQEMVINSLPWPLLRVRNAAGASILGSGAIVIVLNSVDLLASAEEKQPGSGALVTRGERAEEKTPVIMVADDSITTRTLEKNILEAAGYRVLAAADGLDAWTQMQSENCDLLVSDVVMPRLDGFGLTEKVRADERYKHLPIVLVTSLDLPQDRERGVQAGADAYIVKSAFDQEKLLDTIQRLI
jgi:two-component system chemotaxis sensor kinase CheA